MQTGALILKDLAEKLEELGPNYYSSSMNIDEIQVHLVDLDRAISFIREKGVNIEMLQNLIIRSARLIEAYQVKLAEAEAKAARESEEDVNSKVTKRKTTKTKADAKTTV